MDESGSSTLRVNNNVRGEVVNPLYLVTSKSENSTLSKLSTNESSSKCGSHNNKGNTTENVSSNTTQDKLTTKVEQRSANRGNDKADDKRLPYLSRTLKTPSTLSSCKIQKDRSIAPINSPEKILICIDISTDMREQFLSSETGEKFSFMQCAEKALRIFIINKHNISSSHKFAIMFLTNTALWMHDYTTDLNKLFSIMKDAPDSSVDDTFDTADIFDAMSMKHGDDLNGLVTNPDNLKAPPYSYRVIMIYGRTQCIPNVKLLPHHSRLQKNEAFTVDVLYLYSDETQDSSHEKIFASLGDLDFHGNSYIFAVNRLSQVFECFALLLSHPFQRPLQQNTHHILDE